MPGLLDISVICSYSYVNTFFCVGVSFAVSINRCFINKVLFFFCFCFCFVFFVTSNAHFLLEEQHEIL